MVSVVVEEKVMGCGEKVMGCGSPGVMEAELKRQKFYSRFTLGWTYINY